MQTPAAFPLTAEQIETVDGYTLATTLESFWRANGMRTGRGLTSGEMKAEALHWAERVSA